MVFLGRSRGCRSCKRRHKKCDETRPSCMRCTRAGRVCSGYEPSANDSFLQYGVDKNVATPRRSTARKCGLPKRIPIAGTNILPKDDFPPEVTQEQSNALAVRAFFYDYCITSTNANLSKSFLTGLEPMVLSLGTDSWLAKACQVAAFGAHGKPLNRPHILELAETYHQDLLQFFAQAIHDPLSSDAPQFKYLAILLGLYQIAICNSSNAGFHDVHARGLAALMQIGHSPWDLLGKVSGVFVVPALGDVRGTLDDLLLSLRSLWADYRNSSTPSELQTLRYNSVALDRRFLEWQHSRVAEFKPTTVGHAGSIVSPPDAPIGYWPGAVDTYFDLYVAGVWNIFRAARLLIIFLRYKLSTTGRVDHPHIHNRIAEDMAASVPYHLMENLQDFLSDAVLGTSIAEPGRNLGGLLLMHPLYVAANMPFLSDDIRNYMRKCLKWIAENQGLGQATVLTESSEIDTEYLESGLMIIWSGFVL